MLRGCALIAQLLEPLQEQTRIHVQDASALTAPEPEPEPEPKLEPKPETEMESALRPWAEVVDVQPGRGA